MTRDERTALADRTEVAVARVLGQLPGEASGRCLLPESEEAVAVIDGALSALLMMVAMMSHENGRAVLGAVIERMPENLRRLRFTYLHTTDQEARDGG
jgi:hypothetical protein